ncbi:MAG TPA: ABC transporter permease subunit [Spirillospora sp.]
MTAATPAARPASDSPSLDRPGFAQLLLAEWTKIRTVRSTLWSLVLYALLSLGFTTLLVSIVTASWDDASAADRQAISADPANFILSSGFFGQLVICVLGVLVICSEYSTGMIRATMLAVPRRLPVLWAKAAVFTAVALVAGLAVSFVSFLIGSAILGGTVPVSLGDEGVLRAVIGSGLYLAMLGLFSLAIGAIVRHTAGAITTVLGLVLVVGPLAMLIPGKIGDYVYGYMPSEAGHLITKTRQGPDDLLSPWEGYGVLAIWTFVLLAVAAYLLKRRDT